VAADLGEDRHRALELLHRLVVAARAVQRVGQVVAKRRLAVAVALGGDERERLTHQRRGRLEVAGREARPGEVVEGGDADAGIGEPLGEGEAALDVASMARTSTRVFVLEVMGRHAGWIAAAAGLAGTGPGEPPHIILLPEVAFEQEKFLARVQQCVTDYGYCVIVVSEGAAYGDGRFLADAGTKDAFGHTQLGGVAPVVANMVRQAHGYKYHWAVADYLQRSARHIASRVDVEQAYAVGKAAVELGIRGVNAVMPIIVRKSSRPYRWSIGHVPLADVANQEKKLPPSYIRADGFGISAACRRYLEPLIAGEAYPPYKRGLPDYVRIRGRSVRRKLRTNFKV